MPREFKQSSSVNPFFEVKALKTFYEENEKKNKITEQAELFIKYQKTVLKWYIYILFINLQLQRN